MCASCHIYKTMNLLRDKSNYKCSVSSVSNKDVKQYGKSFMFDQRNDTSWCSDHGTPQWIMISYTNPVKMSTIKIQFQGGFAGKDCVLIFLDATGGLLAEEKIYPEDINSIQEFKLNTLLENISKMKILFESSTDFFGRIIIYNLEIFS